MKSLVNRKRRLLFQSLVDRRLLAVASISVPEASESDSEVVFTISLDEASDDDLTVLFDTVEDTAVAGSDFEPIVSKPIVFQAGELTKEVAVPLRDDLTRDLDRSFRGRIQVLDSSGRVVPFGEHQVLQEPGTFVAEYDFDEATQRFAYANFDSGQEFYSTSLSGDEPSVLLGRNQSSGQIASGGIIVVSDGQAVVMRGALEEANVVHLYRRPVDGSSPLVRISGPLDSGSIDQSNSISVSPDRRYIVYAFEESNTGSMQLYSVPADGSSAPVRLSDPRFEIDHLYDIGLFFTEDDRVVFQAAQPNDGLYIASLDGSTEPIRLSEGVDNDITIPFPQLSADGEWVFFSARTAPGVRETSLFRVPLDGSLPPQRVVQNTGSAARAITPDGGRVVYRINNGIIPPFDLMSAPVDGSSAPIRLNQELPEGREVINRVLMSHDGDTVFYFANIQDQSTYSVYSVPTIGGEPPMLLGTLPAGVKPHYLSLTPDSQHLVFSTDYFGGPQTLIELYSVRTDGSTPLIRLNGDAVGAVALARQDYVEMSPDGKTISYLSSEDSFIGDVGLFQVPVDGSRPSSRLNLSRHVSRSSVKRIDTGFVYRTQEVDNYMVSEVYRFAEAMVRDDDFDVADFGDAPSPYPVTLAQNGARHSVGSVFLGESVDVEADGQPDAQAAGDEATSLPRSEGIRFLTDVVAADVNTLASVEVVASEAAKLDAWIDFNRDGDWSDPGEQIFVSNDVTAGMSLQSFIVPGGATAGVTAARFRLSRDGGLSPLGSATDGEVEDYVLTVADGTVSEKRSVVLDHEQVSVSTEGGQPSVLAGRQYRFAAPFASVDVIEVIGGNQDQLFEILEMDWPNAAIELDGREGFNTLQILYPGTFDLTAGGMISAKGFSKLDLSMVSGVSIVIDETSIAELAGSDELVIAASAPHQVIFEDAADWVMASDLIEPGHFRQQLIHTVSGRSVSLETPLPWINLLNPFDVNNDGMTSPRDALAVINRLAVLDSQSGSSDLPDPSTLDSWLGFYYDANGDGIIAPRDALAVINRLATLEAMSSVTSESERPEASSLLALAGFDSANRERDRWFGEFEMLDQIELF
ncbi:GEVED domain-containing protein [Stieleria sp. JC731]|uniref:GEVED domain-containing protein n=1 Tax=Pirellulaceae TaxID=2691357 RepID=UPI001E546730|nr:GEVED domain-containing protein [Stieleria sp. JC731]MCC9599750.1 GEVED domain-containing protein [Stieleria sp. JC731]